MSYKGFKKIGLILLVIMFGFVGQVSAGEKRFSGKIERKLEKVVEENMAQCQGVKNIPGMIIGIWVPGKGAWMKAIGKSDLITGKDMQINDKFRIGSNTKTFVVTVLLQLVDEGKISLDDKVSKFNLGLNMPYADKISISQLCNMTSGIPEFSEDEELCEDFYVNNPLKKWTPEEVLKTLLKHPPDFSPGEGWHYSNTGYILLGMIIEKVTGTKIEDEIERRLIKPMKLTGTTFPINYPGLPCPYTHGYELDDDGNWQDVTCYSPSLLWAAGAMISDMQDMKVWVKAYRTGTTNSKITQGERLTFVDVGKGEKLKFGLGIGYTNGWLGYTGGTRGYNTAAYYLPPKDATVIVFVNTTDYLENNISVANKITHDITQVLFPDQPAW